MEYGTYQRGTTARACHDIGRGCGAVADVGAVTGARKVSADTADGIAHGSAAREHGARESSKMYTKTQIFKGLFVRIATC